MSVNVNIKWGDKNLSNVPMDVQEPILMFKQKIQEVTGVPIDKQKLVFKGKMLTDETNLIALNITNNSALMLMGQAESQGSGLPGQSAQMVPIQYIEGMNAQQQPDMIELITQTSRIVKHKPDQSKLFKKIMIQKEFEDTIKRENMNEKIISAIEKTFKEMKNDPYIEKQFCFIDENFKEKRLKKDNIDISLEQYLSFQKELQVLKGGAQNAGIRHFRDSDDKYFGGDTIFKSLEFTTKQLRLLAYRELCRMIIINGIQNGEKYFAQLRCCFIERQPIDIDKLKYHIVFVIEFGRNSLKEMLKLKRKYTSYELLVILRQIVEGGARLEEHQIAQNDYKPENIILNRHYEQVKIIDFGVAMHVSESKHPTLQVPLKWKSGTVAYQSPQLVAAWLKQTEDGKLYLSQNKHCLEYCPLFPGPISPRYSPFKSDVYSVAITICEMAGIDLLKEMLWCFHNRSEIEKKQLLESHIQDVNLVSILMNMLHNDEQQRCSFQQALQQTEAMKGSILQPDNENNHIRVAKLAFKDEQELQRSNQDNFKHFNNKMFWEYFNAGAFDDALFYAEKCLIYAQGYPPQSDKDKLYALQNKGDCLSQLNRYDEAALVYQQAIDYLQSIKGQFDNNEIGDCLFKTLDNLKSIKGQFDNHENSEFGDCLFKTLDHLKGQFINENDYQYELGNCLYNLGNANYHLDKNEEALRNCDDALTALRLNNQQSQPRNEEIISSIYNTQANIYQYQKNFAAAKLKYQQYLEIAIKNNEIIDQAVCYYNMCDLKMRQNEFDEEALQFINNAIQLYTQHYNGQNNIDVLKALFMKCRVSCVIESNENQIHQQQAQQQQQHYQQQNYQTCDSTLELAFQIAKSVKGGGQMNKQYADYIKLQGLDCIDQKYAIAMEKHPAFKNHAIRLFQEAEKVYINIKDKENENETKEWIIKLQL